MSRCYEVHRSPAQPGSLSSLQQYGHSDSDRDGDSDMDVDVDVERCAVKRRCDWSPPAAQKRPPLLLPLPSTVRHMFGGDSQHHDQPDQHAGRLRSFAHVRGNWATHVHVPYDDAGVLASAVKACLAVCRDAAVPLIGQDQFHVSLTRTVVLKQHWIDDFVRSVQQAMAAHHRFRLSLGAARVYVNDECTRTFLGLAVAAGMDAVTAASRSLDQCLAEYHLPPFYQEGSFHLSVAWAVGDCSAALRQLLPQLDTVVAEYRALSPLTSDVTEAVCCCGHRRFRAPLAGA